MCVKLTNVLLLVLILLLFCMCFFSCLCCRCGFYFSITDYYIHVNKRAHARTHKRSAHQRQCLINTQHTIRYQKGTPCFFYTPTMGRCVRLLFLRILPFSFLSSSFVCSLNPFRFPFVSIFQVWWQLNVRIEFHSNRRFSPLLQNDTHSFILEL